MSSKEIILMIFEDLGDGSVGQVFASKPGDLSLNPITHGNACCSCVMSTSPVLGWAGVMRKMMGTAN